MYVFLKNGYFFTKLTKYSSGEVEKIPLEELKIIISKTYSSLLWLTDEKFLKYHQNKIPDNQDE